MNFIKMGFKLFLVFTFIINLSHTHEISEDISENKCSTCVVQQTLSEDSVGSSLIDTKPIISYLDPSLSFNIHYNLLVYVNNKAPPQHS
ncbi:hypothetical protein DID77_01835 [Candidatus Marinamargulisbacteria bacterium SCGC AG-439-L15]|nr:hypothetical protein DID77_01835 [Candidatus Marinamargulisbacteria bacterium SCGC AG-439-L15]